MPMVDPESGLEFCEFHNDRVKHFFCMKHKVTCCRVCSEMIHQKKVFKFYIFITIINLYRIVCQLIYMKLMIFLGFYKKHIA